MPPKCSNSRHVLCRPCSKDRTPEQLWYPRGNPGCIWSPNNHECKTNTVNRDFKLSVYTSRSIQRKSKTHGRVFLPDDHVVVPAKTTTLWYIQSLLPTKWPHNFLRVFTHCQNHTAEFHYPRETKFQQQSDRYNAKYRPNGLRNVHIYSREHSATLHPKTR